MATVKGLRKEAKKLGVPVGKKDNKEDIIEKIKNKKEALKDRPDCFGELYDAADPACLTDCALNTECSDEVKKASGKPPADGESGVGEPADDSVFEDTSEPDSEPETKVEKKAEVESKPKGKPKATETPPVEVKWKATGPLAEKREGWAPRYDYRKLFNKTGNPFKEGTRWAQVWQMFIDGADTRAKLTKEVIKAYPDLKTNTMAILTGTVLAEAELAGIIVPVEGESLRKDTQYKLKKAA
jgi:hypothetical protein